MNLPDEVIDTIMDGVTVEAVEAGARALAHTWTGPDVKPAAGRTVLADTVVDHAGPVIAAAAYRKGREDALAEARGEVRRRFDDCTPVSEEAAEHASGLHSALTALSSLAGEKEKGCPDTVRSPDLTVGELEALVNLIDQQDAAMLEPGQDVILTYDVLPRFRAALSGTGLRGRG